MVLNENVKKLLKEQMWYLATYSDEPNAVPVAFKDITSDGKLVVGDVFMDTTLKNVKLNGKIAVSASNVIGLMTEMYEAVIITAAILLVKLASTVFFERFLILFSCTLFILKSNPYRLARKILIICNYNSEPRPAALECNLF